MPTLASFKSAGTSGPGVHACANPVDFPIIDKVDYRVKIRRMIELSRRHLHRAAMHRKRCGRRGGGHADEQ